MMNSPVSSRKFAEAIKQIVGLDRIINFSVEFDCNKAVIATVTFYLDEKRAESVLTLFDDGKWRTPTNG